MQFCNSTNIIFKVHYSASYCSAAGIRFKPLPFLRWLSIPKEIHRPYVNLVFRVRDNEPHYIHCHGKHGYEILFGCGDFCFSLATTRSSNTNAFWHHHILIGYPYDPGEWDPTHLL